MRKEIEVMRIVRVPPMGKLVVQVGNRRLESLAEVSDDGMRRRLVTAIGELIVFAGGYEQLVNRGVAPPPSAAAAGSDKPAARTDETLTAEQEAFLNSLERELKATIQAAPPPVRASLDDVKVELAEPVNPAGPPNLVAEIDEILQRHLAQDPALKNRSVHLEQPPSGILQIRVDNAYYQHPKEIEDEKVREAIKKALQEWESR